jgi:small subunit ribosomal protein S10
MNKEKNESCQGERIRINKIVLITNILEKSASDIVRTAKGTGARITAPYHCRQRKRFYTVLRSPHVKKKSREQFEKSP